MADSSNSTLAPRRGFLRGLLGLPLLGGGLSLLGAPTAVAAPVTDALRLRYLAFLAHEHRAVLAELNAGAESGPALGRPGVRIDPSNFSTFRYPPAFGWLPEAPDLERLVCAAPASTRAALVMSAANVAWT